MIRQRADQVSIMISYKNPKPIRWKVDWKDDRTPMIADRVSTE